MEDNFKETIKTLIDALKNPMIPKLKFKKLDERAIIPSKANPTDAGFDLTAVSVEFNSQYNFYEIDSGLAVEIPDGFVGFIAARSSVSKTGMSLCNGIGIVDAPYRGSLKGRFYKNTIAGVDSKEYGVGDRFMQLIIVPIPQFELEEVTELSETKRGVGGFGSSGS